MLASGTILGRYEIVTPVGAGGMGEVYRARDTRLNREVAAKVLPVTFAQDRERLRRFEDEARAAAALNHPNILVVYDVGTEHGAPYIISELLEGETLRERLQTGPLPLRKAVEYAAQLAHGVPRFATARWRCWAGRDSCWCLRETRERPSSTAAYWRTSGTRRRERNW